MDMTEGSAVKLLIIFAIPMMIGNIFQQLYNVADSIVVGKLIGADALAAIGATGSITFLFFALCHVCGMMAAFFMLVDDKKRVNYDIMKNILNKM